MIDLLHIINHALLITFFIFTMMLLVDYCNLLACRRTRHGLHRGLSWQYVVASFLGVTPGCLGAFAAVTGYVRGFLSFGALAGAMIATSGDEAFVMLAMFPRQAMLLFGILFLLGIAGSWLADKVAGLLHYVPRANCVHQTIHPEEECRCFDLAVWLHPTRELPVRILLALVTVAAVVALGREEEMSIRVTLLILSGLAAAIILMVPDHYLEEHIWKHIIKQHLGKIFLWTFCALLLINWGLQFWDIKVLVEEHMAWVFLLALLVGLIPESGPHLVFVILFADGLIPFSILLASSIVQDGHGMLPLFSYSVKDALLIKIINCILAIAIGLPLLLLGW